jgi:hypothetical protein
MFASRQQAKNVGSVASRREKNIFSKIVLFLFRGEETNSYWRQVKNVGSVASQREKKHF